MSACSGPFTCLQLQGTLDNTSLIQCFLYLLIRQKSIFPLCILFCPVAKIFILSLVQEESPDAFNLTSPLNRPIAKCSCKSRLTRSYPFPIFQLVPKFLQIMNTDVMTMTAKKLSLSKR